jgi:DNA phosphorothioation-associated putative methyltransferase
LRADVEPPGNQWAMGNSVSRADWLSDRHKTAIGRSSLSMPAKQALLDGVLRPEWTLLDYGSGRGGDVTRLVQLGIPALGWDPHHGGIRPEMSRDVVTLTYVVNVIEDPLEREMVLGDAWELSERCLVVSTRLTWERAQVNGTSVGDGTVTKRNTFQHLYSPAELRSLVERTTGVRAISPVPGVVYAFRHDDDRLAYLARRVAPEQVWPAGDDMKSAVAAVVDFLERRGRMPELEETPDALLPLLRNVTRRNLTKLAYQEADPEQVEQGRKRSVLNILLLLGIEVFNGRSPPHSLSIGTQTDIRAFFDSYRTACRRADRLLLKLRDDIYLRNVMRNGVGKMTPTAIYVHRRAVESMPVLLKLYEHCGAIAVGRPTDWDLVKLSHEGRAVSWLGYPEFDKDPHPRLAWSYSVDMRTLEGSYRRYAESDNRPLLHRKHEFLDPKDPKAATYRRLTDQEIRAGLYAQPHLIGNERSWNNALDAAGVRLSGHRLVRIRRRQQEQLAAQPIDPALCEIM